MSCFDYRVDLKPDLVGEFDLTTLNLGYRYSPWKWEDGRFCQGLLCGDQVVKLSLSDQGGGCVLDIESRRELSNKQLGQIREKVLFCLGLEDDLLDLADLAARDSHLRQACDALPGYRLKATPTLYEAILSAVISQNCSRDAFFAMLGEFRGTFGRKTTIDGKPIEAFPLPDDVAEATTGALKNPGLAYRMKSIKTAADALTNRLLTQLEEMPPEDGIEELKKIKGIGDYTARVAQLYGLRRYRVGFVDGYVQKLIGRLYLGHPRPSPREVLDFAEEKWGNRQGYALDLIIAYVQSVEQRRNDGAND